MSQNAKKKKKTMQDDSTYTIGFHMLHLFKIELSHSSKFHTKTSEHLARLKKHKNSANSKSIHFKNNNWSTGTLPLQVLASCQLIAFGY